MKKLYCIILFLFMTTAINAQDKAELQQFFTSFKEAAVQKDVMRLNSLIYPFKYADKEWNYRLEDIQDRMLQGVLRGNITHKGQGAFSLTALEVLIKNHLDEFKTCPADMYQKLCDNKILGKVIPKFQQEEIFLFAQDKTDTHIMLLQTESGLQLLAWKNLNELIDEMKDKSIKIKINHGSKQAKN